MMDTFMNGCESFSIMFIFMLKELGQLRETQFLVSLKLVKKDEIF